MTESARDEADEEAEGIAYESARSTGTCGTG